jgi:PAS domain S-box-containing protein
MNSSLLLRTQKNEILQRWAARVKHEVNAAAYQTEHDLYNNYPELIDAISAALEEHATPTAEALREKLAESHAMGRANLQQYHLRDICSEYAILGEIIGDVLKAANDFTPAREMMVWRIIYQGTINAAARYEEIEVHREREMNEALSRKEAHFRLLSEAGSVLARSLDLRGTLNNLADAAIPALADWCTVLLCDGKQIHRVIHKHRDPERQAIIEEIVRRYPLDLNSSPPLPQVLETRTAVLVSRISSDFLDQVARDAQHRRLLERLDANSVIAVPMIAHDSVLGILVFGTVRPRLLSPADEQLAEELAKLAAMIVDKSVCYEQVLGARELADRHQHQLQLIIDTAPVAIVCLDRELRFVVANQAFAKRHGLKLDTLPGKLFQQTVPASAFEAFRPYLERALAGEAAETAEVLIVPAPGKIKWVQAAFEPDYDDKHRVRGIVGVINEITELKLAIESAHHNEEALKEANHHKDEFLAMLGHELRNPLGPIKNAMFLLRENRDERVVIKAHEMVERQVNQMAKLIDDLLDVSRISRGQVLLRKERIDLARIVRGTVDDYFTTLGSAGIHCESSISEQPIWIVGDPTRIAQVVSNILHNAEKFSSRGCQVHVSVLRENSTAVVRIRDTGIGIDAETLPHIFDAFVQADKSLGRSKGGLGLGLALAKGLIELHGGEVKAFSGGLGQGTTVEVRLPVAAAEPEVLPSINAGTSGPAVGHRVLVIEDIPDAAESLKMVLEIAGHTVEVALNGTDGLLKLSTFAPELVLCDIGLPGDMSGYDVARAIRSRPDLQGTLLVAMTGYGQDADRRQAREAGFDLYLTKPVDPDNLQKLLEAIPAHA